MMKTVNDINLYTFNIERELDFTPEHFVMVKIPITVESREYILEKLTGRFSLVSPQATMFTKFPSFEDPKEATFFELAWG